MESLCWPVGGLPSVGGSSGGTGTGTTGSTTTGSAADGASVAGDDWVGAVVSPPTGIEVVFSFWTGVADTGSPGGGRRVGSGVGI
jgi:hypothetical protein